MPGEPRSAAEFHRDDVAPCDAQRDFNKLSANQRLAAFD